MKLTKETITKTEEDKTIDTDLQLRKYLLTVHTRINKDIPSDFILAKLDGYKEGIIETITTAYYVKSTQENYLRNHKTWHYNHKTKQWERNKIQEPQKNQIQKSIDNMFDRYLIKPYMISALNRNINGNWIIEEILQKIKEETEQQQEETPKETITRNIKPENI